MKFTLLSTLLATACAKKPAQHLRALSGEGEDIMSMPASITPADPAAAWWGNDGHNSLGHLLGAFHHLDVENACGPYCPVPPTTTSTTTTTPTTTTVATTATTTSTSTGPVCDCLITNVDSLSNDDSVGWGPPGADACAGGTDGWDFELCLQTSGKGPRGAEQTTGTVTLKSPAGCAGTPDEIVCVIDKFRVNPYPGWPLSKWNGPSIKVAGTASYDADGSGAQLHSCAVVLGKSDDVLAAIQFTLLPVGENTYHEWMYSTDYPASGAARFRDFQSETSDTTIPTAYTDISADIVQELNLCGLVAPVEES